MRHTAHRSIGRLRAVVPARAHASVGDPEITSLDVSEGSFLGGTTVVITGTDFNNVSSVTFNGVAATINSSTATSINVTTAASADNVGLGNVVVTTPVGTDTLTNGWTYSVLLGATEYWLASDYSGSGSWLGAKSVANLALPGGSNNPSFHEHSTSGNPFGAGVDYVRLPGTSGNCVSTPDTAALDIVGDITVVGWVAPDDWTPSAINVIAAKADASGQYSWFMYLNTDGTIRLSWFSGGTGATQVTISSTVATGFTDGVARYVAASLDVDNGSSQNVVKFWTSTDGATWSQLGTTVTTAGVAAIFSSTSRLEIGSYILGTFLFFAGSIARTQVYSGVRDFSGTPSGGTLVADFNPNGGTFSATETTLTGTGDGLTWTINRSASGRRAWAITRDAWSFGTDDYLSVADNALFDFGASQDFTVAALFRAIQDADSLDHALITKRDTGTDTEGWMSRVTGSSAANEFTGVVETANVATAISDATWNNPGQLQTHVFTRTAGATGTLDLYTDGVSVGGAGAVAGDLANATALNIGRVLASGVGANYYDGLIYGLAISRTGLTAAQVTYLDTELRADA